MSTTGESRDQINVDLQNTSGQAEVLVHYIPLRNHVVQGKEMDTQLQVYGLCLGEIINHQGLSVLVVDLTDSRPSYKDDAGNKQTPPRLTACLDFHSVERIQDEKSLPDMIKTALVEERLRRNW